jgi:phage-related protein
MAGSRTLKLSILGDVDNLNKSLKAATADVDTFGDKMTKAGKVIGAALAAAAAAAGAYAIKIGVEGVKAAIADEKAQTQLALALENATGATKGAIAATEQFILQTSLATGVADDELRPALGRLARSTGDVTAAQDLLKTALDVATATGKPLEAVAQALGKAYDGNTTSLGRLGIGLSSAELKTMSFTDVQGKLTDLFGGAAAANADTYSGRIARMQIAFDEAKETIGFALLPILEKLMKFINQIALPAINAMSSGFGLDKGGIGGAITTLGNIIINTFTPIINGLIKAFGYVKNAIGDNLDTFKEFGGYIATYLAPVIGTVLGGALQVVGKIAGGVINVIASVIETINGLISGAIEGINTIIRAYNAVPKLPNIGLISAPAIAAPTVPKSSSPSLNIPSVPTIKTPSVSGASSGTSSAAASAAAIASALLRPVYPNSP